MAGGPPEGKGDHGASSSGAGPSSNDANDHQNGDGVAQQDQQTVSVVGGDMYSRFHHDPPRLGDDEGGRQPVHVLIPRTTITGGRLEATFDIDSAR